MYVYIVLSYVLLQYPYILFVTFLLSYKTQNPYFNCIYSVKSSFILLFIFYCEKLPY
jgi:hypothetical protein